MSVKRIHLDQKSLIQVPHTFQFNDLNPTLKTGYNLKRGIEKRSSKNMIRGTTVTRWLFSTDVDDTILGDDDSLAILAAELKTKRERVILTLNSSRPCASVRKSMQENPLLPEPDFLVGALGTEIEIGGKGQRLEEYTDTLSSKWDRGEIEALMNRLQLQAHPAEFQTPHKASYSIKNNEQYKQVQALLEDSGIESKVIHSGHTNLDFIPKNAGKGAAIQYLRSLLNIDLTRIVVAGDSLNDIDMFKLPNKVIIVANAEAEIKSLMGDNIYHAQSRFAAGVLEGLRFWRVL
jgi:sucrose-6F-phosphate phosphohydrolase